MTDLEIPVLGDILGRLNSSIMRLSAVVLNLGLAVFVAMSCNQPRSQDKAAGNDSVNASHSTPRAALVVQLRLMGQRLNSGDSHQIAQIFRFPVPDSELPYYGDDTAFNRARARDSNTITAATFQRYFKEISNEMAFDEFSRAFQQLRVDRLLRRDSIQGEVIKKKEPCYHFYIIQIEGDSLVRITCGMNSRKDYDGPETKDPDFDISSLCEHDTFWDFVFDGRQLNFIKKWGAD